MKNYVILVMLMLLASFVGSEAMLRLYAIIDRGFGHQFRAFDLMSLSIEAHGELGYRQKPNVRFEYANGTVATTNKAGYRGPVAEPSNTSGAFRIVLLGGSTTHGWGVNDNQTIGVYMREFLADYYPSRAFEVINLAFDGYDTTQLVERFVSNGIPLKPDLVIVNAGINDVRNFRFKRLRPKDIRTVLWLNVLDLAREEKRLGHPSLWTQTKHYLYVARFPGFVRDHWQHRRALQEKQEIVSNSEAADIFEQNLRQLGAMIHAQGGIAIYSNPPSSLTTRYPPEHTSSISYWINNAATTQELRDILVNRTHKVVAELANQGLAVRYVHHALTDSMFIDDCHLTPEGNRQMAVDFINAIEPFLHLGTHLPAATEAHPRD